MLALGGRSIKNLLSKPATKPYPAEPYETFERTRGSVFNDMDVCIFCGMCARVCPTGAIEVNRDEKSWSIDRCSCVVCNECVSRCPKKCLSMDGQHMDALVEKSRELYVQASQESEAPAE